MRCSRASRTSAARRASAPAHRLPAASRARSHGTCRSTALVALGRLPHGDRGEDAGAQCAGGRQISPLSPTRPVSTPVGGESAVRCLPACSPGSRGGFSPTSRLAALDLGHCCAPLLAAPRGRRGWRGVVLSLLHGSVRWHERMPTACWCSTARPCRRRFSRSQALAEPVIENVGRPRALARRARRPSPRSRLSPVHLRASSSRAMTPARPVAAAARLA